MRVLFTSLAHNTHYYTLVPLAWALRAAGHEVRVASQPALSDTITASGLTAVPVGTDHRIHQTRVRMNGEPRPDHPAIDFDEVRAVEPDWEHVLGRETLLTPYFYALANNDEMVDALVAHARAWRPDLVVWEPVTFAGAVAARAAGAAHARLMWGSDVLGSARRTFLRLRDAQPPEHREDPLRDWLTWTLERHSCTFDEEAVTGQWTIDPAPASLRLPTGLPTVGMRYVPYNGPSVLPEWLSEPPERPRICLTLGVSAREVLGGDGVSLADLIEGLADLDIELVATLDPGQREALGRVPANTRLVDFVPLDALLPSCAGIIHHGGAGTFSTALVRGVPQIVLAALWDAPVKARRLAELGAGAMIGPAELTGEAVRAQVERLIADPSVAAAAGRLREEALADPSPADLVPELERLAARHRAAPASR
ncbi:activator-dependent family glycosyltransferase [Nocardiopsis composta]|uniref:Tylactone mycaminosyltransferase/glycosyltransferase DesVII n=1 Tax=Nocardiopsis composta TaxID=157465 RepID=A0A7W8QJ77_9ACTN|nr:activator-dependent family glycosyltransferase [Nocardiopsis composta]MBB5431482.1 tylactone mycaminosyltransferase/glycosyltransferase DesVII [Nocardiopsis composta]